MSKKPRATIGRTLHTSFLEESVPASPAVVPNERVYTLITGRKVVFTRVDIPAGELAEKTFVEDDINGRDQSALTPESLKDITSTIAQQQFFPVIGVRHPDGRIELMDGSRRRAAALLVNCGLEGLITDEALTAAEARGLARSIQTAKEHSLREVGLRLLRLKNGGMQQKEIAEREGMSQAKVTRALQAAAVSGSLVAVFPVQSELSHADYKALLDIEETLKAEGNTVDGFLQSFSEELNEFVLSSGSHEEVKTALISFLHKQSLQLRSADRKEKPVITPLWKFSDKNRFARKKVTERAFSYEFSRLTAEVQDEIDAAVKSVLERHLKS